MKGEEKRHIKKGRVGKRSVLTICLAVFNNHDHARDLIHLKSPTCHVLENLSYSLCIFQVQFSIVFFKLKNNK